MGFSLVTLCTIFFILQLINNLHQATTAHKQYIVYSNGISIKY